MKALGMTRPLDQLGRVTLPIELRRNLALEEDDLVEIYLENGIICLKKVSKAMCPYCGETEHLIGKDDMYICKSCLDKLQ